VLQWLHSQYSPEKLWAAWGAIIVGYAGFMILERLIPAQRHPAYREFGTEIRVNLTYVLLNPVGLFLAGLLTAPLAHVLGGPLYQLDLRTWGTSPLKNFVLAFAPLFVFDFFYYWYHRFQHSWPWLWQVHRLHHTDSSLNVTTNFRHHWLEEFFRAFFILLPMNWLISITPVASAVAALLIGQWSNFFHANVRIGFGPLSGLITGPQYHRIHHSIEAKHFEKNYAAFFPIWDWAFRTYRRPERGEWPQTGLAQSKGIMGFREVALSPFSAWWSQWRKGSGKNLSPVRKTGEL